MRYVIDIGSRSVKLFHLRSDGFVGLVSVTNWDAVTTIPTAADIGECLDELTNSITGIANIAAIGTAAVRRSPAFQTDVSKACDIRGIAYQTISQQDEAELIRAACPEFVGDSDIVNAGGGSIQVVLADRSLYLLPFGISDLNKRYELTGPPRRRLVQACIDSLVEHLSPLAGQFVYTGGERTYLKRLGVSLQPNGTCRREDFMSAARLVATTDLVDLERASPYGAGWMHGAVASNCIVAAYFERSGAITFVPSDVNIAHGFLAAYASRTWR